MCVSKGGEFFEGHLKVRQRGHHTEHFSTGFIGELFGQWKTRANSSNWETLPMTLQGGGNGNIL